MRLHSLKKLLCAVALLTGSAMTSAATVDWLVLYDDYSARRFNNDVTTAMRAWTTQMNNIYRASNVDIQLRLVGVRRNQFDAEASSGRSAMSNALRVITNSASVARVRDEVGADFVMQLHRTGRCGVGWVSVRASRAFNITGPQCGVLTAIHELGHNMGLRHSRRQGDTGGTRYRYALGYGVDNRFATVMAYPSSFNTRRIGRFSNADQTYSGLRLGVPIGQPAQSHSSRALRNVSSEISRFRPATVSTERFVRLEHRVSSLSLDGQRGGANEQNVLLSNSDPNNVNQQWKEINRGNGYYTYQKRNTNYCIDGNNRGDENRQPIILWPCDDANRNQHFRKVSVGSGYFRLEKRSASGVSISSWGNPQSGQNTITWASNNNNRYQQWRVR